MKRALIILAIVAFFAAIGLAYVARRAMRPAPAESASGVRSERRGRDESATIRTLEARVEDVPIPEGIPYVGEEGAHADGYPRKTADRAVLIALLHAGDYARLTSAFTTYLAEYRANPKFEYVLLDAIGAVSPADPAIEAALDAWVVANPDSFAPYAARGSFRVALARAYRGDAFAADTSDAKLEAMRREIARAWVDLERGAVLASNASPLLVPLLDAARLTSDDAREASVRMRAERDCASCVAWRETFIATLEPKWGGSAEAMGAFERDSLAHVSENARLATFSGRATYLAADWDARERPVAERIALIGRHIGASTNWVQELRRARLLIMARDYDAVLVSVRRVLEQRPGLPHARSLELSASWGKEAWDEAAELATYLARVEPDDEALHSFIDRAATRYPMLAYERLAQSDVAGATRLMSVARTFAPGSTQFVRLSPRFASDVERAPAIVSAVEANLDDYDAVVAYDRFFFELGQFDAIAARWTTYLERHPDDVRALSERCGTYTHARRWGLAARDCEAVCRHRGERSCPVAERLRSNARRTMTENAGAATR